MKYSKALDGLRGIAIITVCLYHWKVPGVSGGFFGVDIFFVISGYLITSILLYEFHLTGDISFPNFYFRRFLRLFPALFVMLALYGCTTIFAKNPPRHWLDIGIAFFYLSNWFMAAGGNHLQLLGHTWSLSIEEQFYLLWPATMYLLLKKVGSGKLMAITLFLAVCSTVERAVMTSPDLTVSTRIYFSLDTRLDCLLYGCLLAMFLQYRRGFSLSSKILDSLSLLGGAGLTCLMVAIKGSDNIIRMRYGFFLTAMFTICILLAVAAPTTNRTQRLLSLPVLTWFGKRCYGLYLWHFFIYRALNAEERGIATTVVAAVAALIVTELSFRFIEKPALSLKERFAIAPEKGRDFAGSQASIT